MSGNVKDIDHGRLPDTQQKTYNPRPESGKPFNPFNTHQPKAPAETQQQKPLPPAKND